MEFIYQNFFKRTFKKHFLNSHLSKSLIINVFSAAKRSWKKIVSKYFCRSGRKTIRKMDLPSLFNELYTSAFTSKQVLGGFLRAGVWPYNADAMKDKVVKEFLPAAQINQSPSTTK